MWNPLSFSGYMMMMHGKSTFLPLWSHPNKFTSTTWQVQLIRIAHVLLQTLFEGFNLQRIMSWTANLQPELGKGHSRWHNCVEISYWITSCGNIGSLLKPSLLALLNSSSGWFIGFYLIYIIIASIKNCVIHELLWWVSSKIPNPWINCTNETLKYNFRLYQSGESVETSTNTLEPYFQSVWNVCSPLEKESQ